MIRSSSPSSVISVPPTNLPKRMRSPALTPISIMLARILAGAFADRDDFAFRGLFLGAVGDDQTTLGLVFTLDTADKDTVVQRFECHLERSFVLLIFRSLTCLALTGGEC